MQWGLAGSPVHVSHPALCLEGHLGALLSFHELQPGWNVDLQMRGQSERRPSRVPGCPPACLGGPALGEGGQACLILSYTCCL